MIPLPYEQFVLDLDSPVPGDEKAYPLLAEPHGHSPWPSAAGVISLLTLGRKLSIVCHTVPKKQSDVQEEVHD